MSLLQTIVREVEAGYDTGVIVSASVEVFKDVTHVAIKANTEVLFYARAESFDDAVMDVGYQYIQAVLAERNS